MELKDTVELMNSEIIRKQKYFMKNVYFYKKRCQYFSTDCEKLAINVYFCKINIYYIEYSNQIRLFFKGVCFKIIKKHFERWRNDFYEK